MRIALAGGEAGPADGRCLRRFFKHLQGVVCHLKALAALSITKEDRRSAWSREPAVFAAPAPTSALVGVTTAKPRPFAVLVGDASGHQLLVVYFCGRLDSDMWFHGAPNTSPGLRCLARLGPNHDAAMVHGYQVHRSERFETLLSEIPIVVRSPPVAKNSTGTLVSDDKRCRNDIVVIVTHAVAMAAACFLANAQ